MTAIASQKRSTMTTQSKLIAVGALTLTGYVQASTVIYYNLTNPLNHYVGGFPYVEAADEISLGDGPRFFDKTRIAYYGANFDGDETLTLTLYRMDGPPNPNSFGFNTPGTPLFSQTVPIPAAQVGLAEFSDATGKVLLPDDIAVGLAFQGVDFVASEGGNDAGPLIYDPPTIGSSFSDFWIRGVPNPEDPWALYTFDEDPNANFGIEISVSADGDNDGVSDAADNCPATANADQADADDDGIGDACDQCPDSSGGDTDGDGVCDINDAFPNSRDVGSTVHVGDCDTGVANTVFPDGSTISDKVHALSVGARNHGQFVSAVAKLKNSLRKAGTLTAEQAEAIQRCAAQSKSKQP